MIERRQQCHGRSAEHTIIENRSVQKINYVVLYNHIITIGRDPDRFTQEPNVGRSFIGCRSLQIYSRLGNVQICLLLF